jgi:hypothetical protein
MEDKVIHLGKGYIPKRNFKQLELEKLAAELNMTILELYLAIGFG